MGRSYRPTAYLGFGRVYFNIAASDAPEPLSPFTECAVGSFDMSDGHQNAPSMAGPRLSTQAPTSMLGVEL
jgi:hypothetical protein